MNKLIGYFITAHTDKPEYDPGLDVPCVFCYKHLIEPIRTVSFMMPGSFRSFFYRCHKSCYENMNDDEIGAYEESVMEGK